MLVPLALCAGLLGFVPGASAAGAATARVAQSQVEVTGYWTQARMDAAKPASELLGDVVFPDRQAGQEGLLGGTGSASATPRASAVGNESASRVRTHGKVFLTLPDGDPLTGDDFVCSGTVIRSRTKRLVVTAGHCVHGFGRFASNFMFIPAYDGSQSAAENREPFGRWTARSLATTRQWASGEDLRYDVGMATLRGRKIQRVVGARRIAFNQNRNQFFQAYGYPAAGEFNGEQLYRCDSQYEGTDSRYESPAPNRISCDMTGGSSGGGWVIGNATVNSVVSYRYECEGPGGLPLPLPCESREEGKLFGPYFGQTIKGLYISQRGKKRKRKRR